MFVMTKNLQYKELYIIIMKKYDVVIIGAGPAGIFAAYELTLLNKDLKIAIIEKGKKLSDRVCPIDGTKVTKCINCKECSIMNGFGGAGGFSDGKYNITNNFGGELYKYVGREQAIELMNYVDKINIKMGGEGCKLYSTVDSSIKQKALQHDLHLLDASVRHLGTDVNKIILTNLYHYLENKVDIYFQETAGNVQVSSDGYSIETTKGLYSAKKLIIAGGRSGSAWVSQVCKDLNIKSCSNRVDIGVRVEIPELVFHHLTESAYEAKIVYRTKKYNDLVRTFCMNPYGIVVNENTNGIVTVNGHSYSDKSLHTENTNFALLVSNTFSHPFNDSNAYGEHIARLANMLSGGVIVQRFGDLVQGRRTTEHRLSQSFVTPTLTAAVPGDLSLVLPKRQMDDIVEMIYALENIAPGMANADTLLYGVEVKFYNSMIEVNNNLETSSPGLYVIGDCSGTSHSLSVAAAEGVFVARTIEKMFK